MTWFVVLRGDQTVQVGGRDGNQRHPGKLIGRGRAKTCAADDFRSLSDALA
jgi:hypothetical protein